MPPRRANNSTLVDEQITLRLKHGIHTIFLFVMHDWTFARISADLLSILQDRYPDGLSSSIIPPKTTPVPKPTTPEAENLHIVYGVPRDPDDLSQGYKSLNAGPDDTVFEKRLSDLNPVAFALVPGSSDGDVDMDEDEITFDVELPLLDDELS